MKIFKLLLLCLTVPLCGSWVTHATAETSPEVADLLKAITAQESRLGSLTFVESQHMTAYKDATASVTRRLTYEEQAGSYRLSVEYPGISELKQVPGKELGKGIIRAYVPCETAYDGKIMTNYVPFEHAGYITTSRRPLQIDEMPVTNYRPFWPRRSDTLSDVLNSIINDPAASVAVEDGATGLKKLDVNLKGARIVFTLDSSKDYSLTQLDSYAGTIPVEHRIFEDYVQKNGVWLAQRIRVEMLPAARSSIYTVEDGWKANEPISPSRFRLTFPANNVVHDLVHHREFIVPDGQAYLESKLDDVVTVPALAPELGVSAALVTKNAPATRPAAPGHRDEAAKAAKPPESAAMDSGGPASEVGAGDWIALSWRPVGLLAIILLLGGALWWAHCKTNQSWLRSKPAGITLALLWLVAAASGAAYAGVYLKTHDLGPVLVMESRVIDVGNIPAELIHVAKLPIYNHGTQTLHITDLKKSCSCSAAKLSNWDIEPGGTATLELHYTPTLNISKDFSTNLIIESNSRRARVIGITLAGHSEPGVEIAPPEDYLGRIRRGSSKIATFRLFDPPGMELVVTEKPATVLTDNVTLVSAERFTEEGKSGVKVSLRCAPATEGIWKEQVSLSTNCPKAPKVGMTLSATVNNQVNAWPGALEFGGDGSHSQSAVVGLNGLRWDPGKGRIVVKPDFLEVHVTPASDPESSVMTVGLRAGQSFADVEGGHIEVYEGPNSSAVPACTVPFVVRAAVLSASSEKTEKAINQ